MDGEGSKPKAGISSIPVTNMSYNDSRPSSKNIHLYDKLPHTFYFHPPSKTGDMLDSIISARRQTSSHSRGDTGDMLDSACRQC